MLQLNCKVGDLAIVVNTELPQNLGQIVEVLGPQTGEPHFLPGPGHFWRVRAVSGRKTLVYRFNINGRIEEHAHGPRARPLPSSCFRAHR